MKKAVVSAVLGFVAVAVTTLGMQVTFADDSGEPTQAGWCADCRIGPRK